MCESPPTASALDAASHNGFDKGADVFVFHSSFPLCEAAPVTAKLHGLVLQRKKHSVVRVKLILNHTFFETVYVLHLLFTGGDYLYPP